LKKGVSEHNVELPSFLEGCDFLGAFFFNKGGVAYYCCWSLTVPKNKIRAAFAMDTMSGKDDTVMDGKAAL